MPSTPKVRLRVSNGVDDYGLCAILSEGPWSPTLPWQCSTSLPFRLVAPWPTGCPSASRCRHQADQRAEVIHDPQLDPRDARPGLPHRQRDARRDHPIGQRDARRDYPIGQRDARRVHLSVGGTLDGTTPSPAGRSTGPPIGQRDARRDHPSVSGTLDGTLGGTRPARFMCRRSERFVRIGTRIPKGDSPPVVGKYGSLFKIAQQAHCPQSFCQRP